MITEKKYELMTIFPPALTEKEVEKELDAIKKLVGKKGKILHEQVWGKRDLYYTLKGHAKAIYTILHFVTEESVNSLSKELKLMPHILRFLLLELPKNYELKPFVALEEPPVKEEKLEEKKVKKLSKTKKIDTVTKEEKITKKEVAAFEEKKEEKTIDTKKKKSSFDEKIDEIIGNLDNL